MTSTTHVSAIDDDVSRSRAAEGSGGRPHVERNRLLRALPAEEYELLLPHIDRVDVPVLELLVDANTPPTHVMFPETGVISIVNRFADGSEVEVGTIGNEGMAGLNVVLGGEALPSITLMEIPGRIARVPADVVAQLVAERPAMQRLFNRYAQAFLIQVGQTAACNRAHEISGRCARWMCMSHDRMGGADHYLLTQHVLAQMLGVRRAGVTVAAGALQKRGLIRYSRGKITVLDRPGLERAACECYGIVKEHFDRLLGDDVHPRPA
jgi:CRP-like cAMP-binding protein